MTTRPSALADFDDPVGIEYYVQSTQFDGSTGAVLRQICIIRPGD